MELAVALGRDTEGRWIDDTAIASSERARLHLQSHEGVTGKGRLERTRELCGETEARIILGMAEDNDNLPAALTCAREPGADQGAADAAALSVRAHRHRRQRQGADRFLVDRNGKYTEKDVADDLSLLDGDQLDCREIGGAQVFNQPRFVGTSERKIIEAPDRFVVRWSALSARPGAHQMRCTP